MFSLNGNFEKKWVGRAMRNETIYWDGLKIKCCTPVKYRVLSILSGPAHPMQQRKCFITKQ